MGSELDTPSETEHDLTEGDSKPSFDQERRPRQQRLDLAEKVRDLL